MLVFVNVNRLTKIVHPYEAACYVPSRLGLRFFQKNLFRFYMAERVKVDKTSGISLYINILGRCYYYQDIIYCGII